MKREVVILFLALSCGLMGAEAKGGAPWPPPPVAPNTAGVPSPLMPGGIHPPMPGALPPPPPRTPVPAAQKLITVPRPQVSLPGHAGLLSPQISSGVVLSGAVRPITGETGRRPVPLAPASQVPGIRPVNPYLAYCTGRYIAVPSEREVDVVRRCHSRVQQGTAAVEEREMVEDFYRRYPGYDVRSRSK